MAPRRSAYAGAVVGPSSQRRDSRSRTCADRWRHLRDAGVDVEGADEAEVDVHDAVVLEDSRNRCLPAASVPRRTAPSTSGRVRGEAALRAADPHRPAGEGGVEVVRRAGGGCAPQASRGAAGRADGGQRRQLAGALVVAEHGRSGARAARPR